MEKSETKQEKEAACEMCGKTGKTLTDDGLCFACLSKKYESPDDDEGTWFNKA